MATSRSKYSLILLDPPYHKGLCLQALTALCERHLAPHVIAICETAPDEVMPERVGPLALSKTTKYGNTRVHLYRTAEQGESL